MAGDVRCGKVRVAAEQKVDLGDLLVQEGCLQASGDTREEIPGELWVACGGYRGAAFYAFFYFFLHTL